MMSYLTFIQLQSPSPYYNIYETLNRPRTSPQCSTHMAQPLPCSPCADKLSDTSPPSVHQKPLLKKRIPTGILSDPHHPRASPPPFTRPLRLSIRPVTPTFHSACFCTPLSPHSHKISITLKLVPLYTPHSNNLTKITTQISPFDFLNYLSNNTQTILSQSHPNSLTFKPPRILYIFL